MRELQPLGALFAHGMVLWLCCAIGRAQGGDICDRPVSALNATARNSIAALVKGSEYDVRYEQSRIAGHWTTGSLEVPASVALAEHLFDVVADAGAPSLEDFQLLVQLVHEEMLDGEFWERQRREYRLHTTELARQMRDPVRGIEWTVVPAGTLELVRGLRVLSLKQVDEKHLLRDLPQTLPLTVASMSLDGWRPWGAETPCPGLARTDETGTTIVYSFTNGWPRLFYCSHSDGLRLLRFFFLDELERTGSGSVYSVAIRMAELKVERMLIGNYRPSSRLPRLEVDRATSFLDYRSYPRVKKFDMGSGDWPEDAVYPLNVVFTDEPRATRLGALAVASYALGVSLIALASVRYVMESRRAA